MNLRFENQLRTGKVHIVAHDKGRVNRASFEQVWVVANFPKLHENVHNAEEVRFHQRCLGLVAVYVFVVEQALAPRKSALDDVLNFFGQLFLDVSFEAP